MSVWDVRVREIRYSLDRFEQDKKVGNEEHELLAANELLFIRSHLEALINGV